MSTLDFTKPASTDLYTAWPTELQGNQSSFGFMLDPTYVTGYTGLATGHKRFNASTTLFEQWNGSAWASLNTGYALKSGGETWTGGPVYANNVAVDWKDTGGTARRIALVSGGNTCYFGDIDNAMAGTTVIAGSSAVQMYVAAAALATFNASGLTMLNNTKLVLSNSAGGEVGRVSGSGAYVSFWNTANTTRMGYLQSNAASDLSLIAENGCVLNLGTGSSVKATIDTSGNIGFRASPSAWGTITAIEGTAGALAFNGTSAIYLTQNAYHNGTNWVYKTSNPVAVYVGVGNQHQWFNAPSGTAGSAATLTQAMTLTNAGSLLVGTTSSTGAAYVIEASSASDTRIAVDIAGTPVGLMQATPGNFNLGALGSSTLTLSTNGANRLSFTAAGAASFSNSVTIAGSAATTSSAIGSSGTAFTLNCALSNVFTLTMTGNVLAAGWTISNPQDGQTLNVFLTQDATGSRTVGWPSSFKWPGGVAGTISTAANAVDLLVLTYRAATGFFYATLAKGFA